VRRFVTPMLLLTLATSASLGAGCHDDLSAVSPDQAAVLQQDFAKRF